jgi:hypothetical protein
MLMQKARRPNFDFIKFVRWRRVVRYTSLQFVVVLIIFAVSFNFFMAEGSPPVAITFPLFIAALIPLRERLVSVMFSSDELCILDPSAETAEGFLDKVKEVEMSKEPTDPLEAFISSNSRFHFLPRSPESTGHTLQRSHTAPG